MPFDEKLAAKLRARIGDRLDVTEKQMFGGLAFLIAGNMAVGVHRDELMVRIGKDAHEEAVSRPGARTFDLSSRPMLGWIVVAPQGITTSAALNRWIDLGIAFAETLPPK